MGRVVSYKKVERPLLTADTAKKLRDKWKELDKGWGFYTLRRLHLAH